MESAHQIEEPGALCAQRWRKRATALAKIVL